MELFRLMIKYYANTAVRSAKLFVKNWVAVAALFAYSAILFFTSFVAARLSFLGGIIYAVVIAACMGSWLYLVETIINSNIVNLNDFKNSFRPYLPRVMNVTFYIWLATLVINLVLMRLLQAIPYGFVIILVIYIAATILLNPLPEFIYQTLHPETQLFSDSVEFIKENFLEWIIPNALFGAVFYFLLGGSLIYSPYLGIIGTIKYIIGILVFLYISIYRGILFRFLNESTRRSRLFKLRMLD